MPAPTAVERMADALRDEILSGALPSGAPLREEQAAERFGVSRHTVRAAFQRLVAERLAESAPYRGVRVTEFDHAQVLALQQLREALEVEAVRIAGDRYGAHWPEGGLAPAMLSLVLLARVAVSLEALRPPGERETTPAWLEAERLHLEVHRAIVAASGSPRIVEAHAALGAELRLFLLHIRRHYSLAELVVEHRELLAEVQAEGVEAMRRHIAHSTGLLLGSPPLDGE